jgi:hypothetical protein
MRAVAQGVGNPILAVGARTGRDGIHGASFASEDLSAESESKRPRVQVGDPFTEKLLLEASLELIRSGDIVAIQDMGAAGLTSSSAEMAARGDVGVVIDTSKVPVREPAMTPYEILLSESQERMLVVAKQGREGRVREVLEKWDLTAAVVGEVIAEPVYRVVEGDRVVAEFPGRDSSPTARRTRPRRAKATRCGRSASRTWPPCPSAPRRRPAVGARRAARGADDREQAVGVPPVRLDGAHQHRGGPGRRRGRGAPARHRPRRRAQGRLQRPPLLPRPARGGEGRRRGGGAQRRVRRRAPAGHHQQPELRQPHAPGGLPPAPRGGGRDGRGLSRVGHAGDGRQRLAVQREPARGDPPDAGRRHGRRRRVARPRDARDVPRAGARRRRRRDRPPRRQHRRDRRQRVPRAPARRGRRRPAARRPRRARASDRRAARGRPRRLRAVGARRERRRPPRRARRVLHGRRRAHGRRGRPLAVGAAAAPRAVLRRGARARPRIDRRARPRAQRRGGARRTRARDRPRAPRRRRVRGARRRDRWWAADVARLADAYHEAIPALMQRPAAHSA